MGQAPREHLYTNSVVPYFRAPHILVGFPMRYAQSRSLIRDDSGMVMFGKVGVSDGVFISSRDGLHWDRRFLGAFIRPGPDERNWTARNIITGWGILPTSDQEISLYYTEHYRHPTARLRRATLRLDGFVSLHAPYQGGTCTTKPLQFNGGRLLLNFATSAVGSVRIEVLDADGATLPGLSGSDAPEQFGDGIDAEYLWSGSADLSSLAGTPVRLRIHLKDADLYALQFVD
jgi:hypothetical protein